MDVSLVSKCDFLGFFFSLLLNTLSPCMDFYRSLPCQSFGYFCPRIELHINI